jgi:hypothetical protein
MGLENKKYVFKAQSDFGTTSVSDGKAPVPQLLRLALVGVPYNKAITTFPVSIQSACHKSKVTSAYFSPDGCRLRLEDGSISQWGSPLNVRGAVELTVDGTMILGRTVVVPSK